LSGVWLGVDLRTDAGHLYRTDYTMCSKHASNSSEHDWRGLHDHLMSTRIFACELHIHKSSKIRKDLATDMIGFVNHLALIASFIFD
jgi:hypothetical protein